MNCRLGGTQWNPTSEEKPDFFQPLKVLLEPTQQQIGNKIYEVAFIADRDGLPLEFIRLISVQ